MTVLAMTLPLARATPMHVPRRDIVIDGTDDLTLQLTLLASDDPGAAPLDLAGIGPVVRMLLWSRPPTWDYGLGWSAGAVFASALATIPAGTSGRADIRLARGFGRRRGLRLGWSLQLDYLGDLSTLCQGALHRRPGGAALTQAAGFDLLDDAGQTLLDDAGQDVEV